MKHERVISYLKAKDPENIVADIDLDEGDSPLIKELNRDLIVSYLIDEGESFSYYQNRDLAREDVEADKVDKFGIYNLANILNDHLNVESRGDVFLVTLDGHFEASLLVVDQLWDSSLAHLVGSGFAVCIPSRDVLVFCDASSEEGVNTLSEVISNVWSDGDHLISDKIWIRHLGEWVHR